MGARNHRASSDSQTEAGEFHILAIRLSALGDVAMTIPVLLALVQQHPRVRITFLTRASFGPLFADIPNTTVFEIRVQDRHKGLTGLWRLYRELRQCEIHAVADLHNVLRTNILKVFFAFSNIPVCSIDKGRVAKKALTRPVRKLFLPLKTTHERYAEVFQTMGFPLELNKEMHLSPLPLPKQVVRFIGHPGGKWIGIAPFAAYKGKMYPLYFMEKVIRSLQETGRYTLFLFGGGDREVELLHAMAAPFENVISTAGRLPFRDQLALISHLDLMISMDSANGHLGALFGIPTVTLWGVTHPYAGFAPFGQPPENSLFADREKFPAIPTSVYGSKAPNGYERSMETIAPETVIDKIEVVLAQSRRDKSRPE